MSIVNALGPLANSKCFILFRLVPKEGGKSDKVPLDHTTGHLFPKDSGGHLNPAHWMTAAEAEYWAGQYGGGHGVGIVIYEGSGLFCVDLDEAWEGQGWSQWALSVVQRFPGAYGEVSVSGRGLHIIGRYQGALDPHGTKLLPLRTEAYTKERFIALTGSGATGDPLSDHTAALRGFLMEYFPPRHDGTATAEWTTEPVAEWRGPADDAELVNRALRSNSIGGTFGGKANFVDLWTANAEKLARIFPPQSYGKDFDHSSADQALANHLAFWTGSNCERMARLMRYSGLNRDKWEREDYFQGTILHAVATQKEWYKDRTQVTVAPGVAHEVSRIADAAPAVGQPPPVQMPPQVQAVTVLQGPQQHEVAPGAGLPGVNIPVPVTLKPGECPPPGTLATSTEQEAMFAGCTYVEDINMVLMPDSTLLDSTRFDNRFPGITFIVTADGTKPTRSAWDAFVQSEVTAFPKVRGLFFAPRETPGAVIFKEGGKFINSYVPLEVTAQPGDYTPFWAHLKKLLPNGQDAEILLYYMAAVVQNPGVKFTWWPFVQGVPGNGKSFMCEALERCVGSKFTHAADASKLGGRFNGAFYGKLFVRVDEVKIDHQRGNVWESLKLLITQEKLEIEAKGVDAVTREVCFNGMLLSNHKNGVKKTPEDRRIAPFFCAQQTLADLYQQGMVDDELGETSRYFDGLWAWANGGGWEIINWFLRSIQIPTHLNPAQSCRRAPNTTSTMDAIMEGWGTAEQEVKEALDSGLPGFKGGWVSSCAVDVLLSKIGKENSVPRNKRRNLLHTLGYHPHPALTNGRSPVRMADGTQPVLYVKDGSEAGRLTDARAVVDAYIAAQK
jgi:Family of unknown function (DUF5906)